MAGPIHYYGFDILEKEGIFHAIVTRRNGISPVPWDSLNLGGTGGDDRARVRENRQLVFDSFCINRNEIFDVWQVHGDHVICTDEPRIDGVPHQKADAILTDHPDIILLMLFADCVPILLYDPVHKVAGIVHAGWKGTVLRVAAKAVEKMKTRYGSQPKDIAAAIGPAIGPDHYQVGDEVIQAVKNAFGHQAINILDYQNGGVKLNLWASNHYILKDAGVQKIEISRICTACNTKDWFSHRAEGGKTGRFGAMIGLRNIYKDGKQYTTNIHKNSK